jgi:RND family efflux transporter MFP subunit
VVAYPGAEVKVGAERGGRLVRVLVEEGRAVRRGELLAELDSDELQAALAEARARVTETDAETRLAEANLARRRQLHEEKILALSDLDQATRDVETTRARAQTARATVARYEAQLAKSRIVAPIAGTLIARRVDAGQMVEAGDSAFTVADLLRLRVEGEAHEADAGAVKLGAPVTITADGYPGRSWRGRVEEIPDAVTLRRLKPQDPSRPTDARVLAVKVAFTEPTPLKLGTTVDLRIAPDTK